MLRSDRRTIGGEHPDEAQRVHAISTAKRQLRRQLFRIPILARGGLLNCLYLTTVLLVKSVERWQRFGHCGIDRTTGRHSRLEAASLAPRETRLAASTQIFFRCARSTLILDVAVEHVARLSTVRFADRVALSERVEMEREHVVAWRRLKHLWF